MQSRTRKYWRLFGCISAAFGFFALKSGHGYELSTHGIITYQSGIKSIIGDLEFPYKIGVDNSVNPFGTDYFDVSADQIYLRSVTEYERDIVEEKLKLKGLELSVLGWLMRGAIREDDLPPILGDNPQDDPYGQETRVLKHFYDPVNDKGLSVPIPILGNVEIGDKAPDWGIGADDAFVDENDPDIFRRNHFTVFDARESMFRALTGMDKAGNKDIGAGGTIPSSAADKEAVRKAYWATTFRALGDIVHLIQDMAQPQHTRNDPHAGNDNYEEAPSLLGHKSFYERFTEDRALGGNELSGRTLKPLPPLVFDGYPIPDFDDFSSYFSEQDTETDILQRKGMADYSNRGFFSAGKNFGTTDYNYPPSAIGSYTPGEVVVDVEGKSVDVLYGEVPDALTGLPDTNVPLTAWGAWNGAAEAATNGQTESFTLIRQNYIAQADLLIPRAVAYSAGLINYFFRGRLEIRPPDEGVYAIVDHSVVNASGEGFGKVKVKIRNVTPAAGGTPQDMGEGDLYAVVKFRRNDCYLPDLSGELQQGDSYSDATDCRTDDEEIVVSDPEHVMSVNRNDPQTITFTFSGGVIPINATDVYLQVVFRGQLGSEADAVVVATKDISEPTYVSVSNSTDYTSVDGVLYSKSEIQASPALLARVDEEGNNNGVPDENLDGFSLDEVSIGFLGSSGYVVTHRSLGVGENIRIAVLQDLVPEENMRIFFIERGVRSYTLNYANNGRVNQLDGNGVPQVDGIDFYDNSNWVGPLRGFHHFRGAYFFNEKYDPEHRDLEEWAYDVSGLAPFSNPNPVQVDSILGGY